MDQGMLSLKWENHKNTFVEVLSNIREKESYCDATIACDNRFYNVHKLVLSSCSEYLREMFDNVKSFSSNNMYPVIILQNVKFKYLEALLDYMYQGEVNVLQGDLPALIKTAECLRIRGLAVPDDEPKQNDTSKRVRESEMNVDAKRQRRRENQQENRSHLEISKEKSYTESNTSTRLDNYSSEQESRNVSSVHRSSESIDSYSGSETKALKQNNDLNTNKDVDVKDVKTEFPSEFEADNYEVKEYLETGFQPSSSHAIPQSVISDQSYVINNQDSRGEPHSSHLLVDDQQSQNHMPGFLKNIFVDVPNDLNDVQPQTFPDGRVGFACPFCLKFYRHKHAFQYHYKTHTGEKPYGCPECPKRFIQRSDLNNHLKIHAGEKSFACPQCPRKFVMKNALDKHLRTHQGLNENEIFGGLQNFSEGC